MVSGELDIKGVRLLDAELLDNGQILLWQKDCLKEAEGCALEGYEIYVCTNGKVLFHLDDGENQRDIILSKNKALEIELSVQYRHELFEGGKIVILSPNPRKTFEAV